MFWVISKGVIEEIERVIADMPSPDPFRKREGSL